MSYLAYTPGLFHESETSEKGWFWCHIRKGYYRWEEYIQYYRDNNL